MRMLWTVLFFLLLGSTIHTNEHTVSSLNAENKLFIITLDGLRWQEVFGGADSALATNPAFNSNASRTKTLFWSPSKEERRKKLMPFFWSTIAAQGQLHGNRIYGNKMDVANPYALSYPGYNELLAGHVDLSIFNNGKTLNNNFTILEFLNATTSFSGKVAAFTSWEHFPFILNNKRSNIHINSGLKQPQEQRLSTSENFLNAIQDNLDDNKTTRADELTFLACKEYVQKKKPSVVLLSFGGTDEAAHDKQYDRYLQQAVNADRMIGELWSYLQTLPEYAGKTTFLITTDHGRGHAPSNWYTHGAFVKGSSQTWMALLGNSIKAGGEQKRKSQVHQKDLKDLMLKILSGGEDEK